MEEKRKLLHEILDLVIDINGFDQRRAEYTDKPAAFFRFDGHVDRVCVDIHDHGWQEGIFPDFSHDVWEQDGISGLEELKEELVGKKGELGV